MSLRFTAGCLALAAVALAAGCSRQPETLTPEAARAKGDALLKQMSQTLANVSYQQCGGTYYQRVSTGYRVVVF
jgi:uncharacterized lipoprotein YajG